MIIFAPITGRGGAVTVVRLSGHGSLAIVASLAGGLPSPRHATLRPLRWQGRVLDNALITVFPAPASFTGEDSAELSLHGGRAVLAALSSALVALGARPAEPGEFSRRAFMNGKLSLLAAEAMADLIAAETEAQRRMAVEGVDALQAACTGWRESLRQSLATQEALIDFPDEDLPPAVERELLSRITHLRDDMAAALARASAAVRLREGLEFVILGPPNAGKSTLLNALANEDVAIVSEAPGTTRDALGVRLDFAGVPVQLVDTAGLRPSQDAIEAEGVRRAGVRAARADFIIALAAPGQSFAATPPGVEVLRVSTKADLGATPPGQLAVSALHGHGLDTLRATLAGIAARLTDTKSAATLARPRQVACVRETEDSLSRALGISEPELRGEELRSAAQALARLVGTIGVEEVLDAVFAGFCIGK